VRVILLCTGEGYAEKHDPRHDEATTDHSRSAGINRITILCDYSA
jgi:hypothetical protein